MTDLSQRDIANLSDPVWRLNNLYSIVDKTGQKVPFVPNDIQSRINACPSKRVRILKARQFGVSTNQLIKMADCAFFEPNKTCVILAHEDKAIKTLFQIVQRTYAYLDDRLKPQLDRGGGSQYEMFFPHLNSRIYATLEVRGGTINWLHISECAFADPERIRATTEAVPLDGIVVKETTPNGMGNHFYDEWTNAEDGFTNLFFPWFLHREYRLSTSQLVRTSEEAEFAAKAKILFGVTISDEQIAFRRVKKAQLKHLFIQEYPEDDQSCFLASGSAAMDLIKVKALFDEAPDPIEEGRGLRIYKAYDDDASYVVGADTAEGVGEDYSVASVFNVRTREQVAVLRGKFRPADFADRLVDLCNRYSMGGRTHPLLAVEANNHGHSVLLALKEMHHYPNLFERDEKHSGWLTDRVTRPVMLDTFREGVENGTVKINDTQTLGECLTLVVNDGKIEAAPGKHDDCVIAAAIGVQMLSENKADLYNNIDKRIFAAGPSRSISNPYAVPQFDDDDTVSSSNFWSGYLG